MIETYIFILSTFWCAKKIVFFIKKCMHSWFALLKKCAVRIYIQSSKSTRKNDQNIHTNLYLQLFNVLKKLYFFPIKPCRQYNLITRPLFSPCPFCLLHLTIDGTRTTLQCNTANKKKSAGWMQCFSSSTNKQSLPHHLKRFY